MGYKNLHDKLAQKNSKPHPRDYSDMDHLEDIAVQDASMKHYAPNHTGERGIKFKEPSHKKHYDEIFKSVKEN